MKKMEKINLKLGLVFVGSIFLFFQACNNSSMKGGSEAQSSSIEKEENILIEPSSQIISVGETAKYKASLKGKDITSSVEWSSSDKSIAKCGGDGTFEGIDVGTTQVMISSEDGRQASAEIQVQRPEELDEGVSYSFLVWGVENCIDGRYDRESGRIRSPCLGDCDDAWLTIDGDLTLGTYNNTIYLVSNKKQSITFSTYSGTWNFKANGEESINSDSYLSIDIKDKSEKKIKSKSLKLHQFGHGLEGPKWDLVETTTISVSKGDAIDLVSHFEGTSIGGSNCPKSSSKLTRNKKSNTGYYLEDPGCSRKYCSIRKN